MTTGQRIKAARQKAGMTQKELAAKLNIPYQGIGQWERGIRNPKMESIGRIADALGVPKFTIIGEDSLSTALEEGLASPTDIANELVMPEDVVLDILQHPEKYPPETKEKVFRVGALCASDLAEELLAKREEAIIIDRIKNKMAQSGPFVKQSPSKMHKAGILRFNSDSDRIAFFYSQLNIDGKLAASKLFFHHIDPNAIEKVADCIEELSEDPQYQRKDPPLETQTPPQDE